MFLRNSRRWVIFTGTAAAIVLASAAQAWSCASLALVEVNPKVAQPGQEVAVKVTFVNKDKPVELRWNALDGPILGVIEPAAFTEGLHGNWRFANGTIRVPENTAPGNYLLIATQEAVRGTNTWGLPARTLLQVSATGSAPVLGEAIGPEIVVRPDTLVTEKGLSGGEMAVIALGAAGFTMLIAGVGIVLASSRKSRIPATAAEVKK